MDNSSCHHQYPSSFKNMTAMALAIVVIKSFLRRLAHGAALISDCSALSQTPAKAAEPKTSVSVYLFTPQHKLVQNYTARQQRQMCMSGLYRVVLLCRTALDSTVTRIELLSPTHGTTNVISPPCSVKIHNLSIMVTARPGCP